MSKASDLRETDFCLYKARQLRANFLGRLKKVAKEQYKERMSEVPAAQEIEAWLRKGVPFKCKYSGDFVPEKSLAIDHAVPVARGGSFDLKNLVITSKLHNTAKGDLTDKEYKQLLRAMSKWEEKAYWSIMNRLVQSTFIYRKKRR